jgi:murein DD-endopeptidase MepM/ murein hydrolase activator NlpD
MLVKLSMELSRRTVALGAIALGAILVGAQNSPVLVGPPPPVEVDLAIYEVIERGELRWFLYVERPPEVVLPSDPWKWELNDLWGAGRGHRGIDVALKTGEKVYSVTDGKVIFSGWDGPYGWVVVVRGAAGSPGEGLEFWYAHLSKRTVKVGEVVSSWDVVGLVGSTGASSGPHLHFGITRGGSSFFDPLPWLRKNIGDAEWRRTSDFIVK